ncbi:MAG: hypothetical protein HKN21_05165, partial [Candidatus Eisenbacteria bacterium]|nr:hypothetical protein [Candidatus Eisenbacteria bacterium]
PTVYKAKVVGDGALPAILTSRTRIRYGQYEKHNPKFVAKLVALTNGQFRTGMIARLVLRDFWTEGVTPTMKQFAEAWVKTTAEHKPRPEGAYLADLSRGEGREGWKAKRIQIAKRAMKELEKRVKAQKSS